MPRYAFHEVEIRVLDKKIDKALTLATYEGLDWYHALGIVPIIFYFYDIDERTA